jgi:NADPH:quinone reductase-like Zn-dependent oxidoreductase
MNLSTIERPVDPILVTGGAQKMKAIVQDEYGSPDVLELREIDRPSAGDGEVLVRVRATSVNPADSHFMRGTPFALRMAGNGMRIPKNPVLGIDVAGVVDAVGKDVTRFRPGDEVFGWCRGAYAEYACAAQDHFVSKPANITLQQAAAIPLAAITALQGLCDKGQIKPGQKVLIVGASGGVGTFAVQIAKALGADVTGVCSTRNVELVQSIGADHVIDYTQDDFVGGEQRYDLIFQLAGTRSPSDCRRALTSKGTLVLSSGDGRANGMGRMVAATVSSPFVSQRLVTWVSKQNHADLMALTGFIEAGQITPVIDKTYSLDETPAAMRYLEAGHTRGKVVIAV